MLWTPQKGIVQIQSTYPAVGASKATDGIDITTGASASTKGSPVQVFSATNFDVYMVGIHAFDYSLAVTESEGCLDIMVGGSGSEDPLIENLLMGQCPAASLGMDKYWMFPVYIPAGTRISAQAAGDRTSTGLSVHMMLWGGDGSPPFRVGSKVTTYGIGTVPNGTAITPGASGGTGAWAQITASTSMDHFALVPSFQTRADTTTNNLAQFVEMGRGASTAEDPVGAAYIFTTDNNEATRGPQNPFPTYVDIPSGTRLVMRASNSGANDGGYDGAIHAVS